MQLEDMSGRRGSRDKVGVRESVFGVTLELVHEISKDVSGRKEAIAQAFQMDGPAPWTGRVTVCWGNSCGSP